MITKDSVVKYLKENRVQYRFDKENNLLFSLKTRGTAREIEYSLNIEEHSLFLLAIPFSMKRRDLETLEFINELNNTFDHCKFTLGTDNNEVVMTYSVTGLNINDASYVLKIAKQLNDIVDLAIPGLERFNDKKNSKINKIVQASVGDVVKFGKYFIHSKDKKEDVEWRVIKVEEKKILLVANQCLDVAGRGWVTQNSDPLLDWLNTTFYSTVFSQEEMEYVRTTNGGFKCFLLPEEWVKSLLVNYNERKCTLTPYAEKIYLQHGRQLGEDNNCNWWLNDFSRDGFAYYIQNYDSILGGDFSNTSGYNNMYGIRPAFWINLENIKK